MTKELRLLVILLLLALLPSLAAAENEESCIVNLIENPDAEYEFMPGAGILEVVFPRVYNSDCAILRFGEETMLVDSSTKNEEMQARIRTAVEAMGVDHFDTAYNSHPHNDHIQGFEFIHAYAPLSKLLITFPEDYSPEMKKAVRFMKENNIPVERVGNGDHLQLGKSGEVDIAVIQYSENESWPDNDKSAMLRIAYGERTLLLTADSENRAQGYFAENPQHVSLDADILKYPHHGLSPLHKEYLEAISPELMFLNSAVNVWDANKKYLEKQNIPYLIGYKGITRMRTDGHIWVVDYLQENGAEL